MLYIMIMTCQHHTNVNTGNVVLTKIFQTILTSIYVNRSRAPDPYQIWRR